MLVLITTSGIGISFLIGVVLGGVGIVQELYNNKLKTKSN